MLEDSDGRPAAAGSREEILMDILTWILSGVLAALFLLVGAGKLATPYEKLRENPRMAWAGDFSPRTVKLIGALEVLGAIGVVLPWLLGIARILTPLAAVGLAAIMVGAILTHRRRGELAQTLPVNAVLLVLAVVVAVLRSGQL
jgi:uncharacterized membrane protein YphA (DoxX/SURF4 family)